MGIGGSKYEVALPDDASGVRHSTWKDFVHLTSLSGSAPDRLVGCGRHSVAERTSGSAHNSYGLMVIVSSCVAWVLCEWFACRHLTTMV